jgi:hypothetical protein
VCVQFDESDGLIVWVYGVWFCVCKGVWVVGSMQAEREREAHTHIPTYTHTYICIIQETHTYVYYIYNIHIPTYTHIYNIYIIKTHTHRHRHTSHILSLSLTSCRGKRWAKCSPGLAMVAEQRMNCGTGREIDGLVVFGWFIGLFE